MFQFGNFIFDKEYEADGYTKLLCHFNWLPGWPSWNLEAKDHSFEGIPETVYGAVSANPAVEGWLNGCAYFPTGNVADYIIYTDDPALRITSKLTLECFISPDKLSGNRTVLAKPGSYRLHFTDGSPEVTVSFSITIGGTARVLSVTYPENVFYGLWLHIKATYDGQYQRLYINGVERGNRAQTGLIDTSTYNFCVGKQNYNNTEPYKGFVDELRISNIVRPFVGTKKYGGKTALAGIKVNGLRGGQSALKNTLAFILEGQSRLKKLISYSWEGKTQLAYFYSREYPGRSLLGKTIRSSYGGYSKLAYYVLEATPPSVAMGSFKVIRMSGEELVNKGHFLYGKDYRAKNFAQSILLEDPASQSRYGVREKTVELNFVRDPAVAAELSQYYFNAFKEIKAKIKFRTFLGGLHVEVGDHILVNYPLYDLSGELFTAAAVKFIAGCGQKHQMDQVEIEAQEG